MVVALGSSTYMERRGSSIAVSLAGGTSLYWGGKVSDSPLHIKYRPQTFDDVIGQDEVVASLQRLAERSMPHAFLFLGPSGTGKTTLARILARVVGCTPQGLIEVDAATNTGIEAMRTILENVRYRALGKRPQKVVIVDEAHALSSATFKSLLLSIEEPPPHVYWILCTTDAGKIPRTIHTRCHTYTLRSISSNTLADYLDSITKQEKLEVTDDIIQVCAAQAFGSMRQALVNLSTVAGVTDRKEAYRLLSSVLEEGDAVELARMLVAGMKWNKLRELLTRLKDENPESVRMVVVSYVQNVLLDARDEKRIPPLLAILDAFSTPFNSSERMAPILLACGGLMYE
jgi:DNA polymerase-3 subunit gamma/tau